MAIAGLEVKKSKDIIGPDTRLCAMVYARPKGGKTTMAATLDLFCQQAYGKRALFIAMEQADGGGITSIQQYDVDYVQPKDKKELEAILRALQTDTTYAAVILDNLTDMVKNIVQPFALSMPAKDNTPQRAMGVPTRSDYMPIQEQTRLFLNLLIGLTKLPVQYRKHVIVNALLADRRDRDDGGGSIGPDLPGAMAESGPAPFELVATIEKRWVVKPDPNDPKKNQRVAEYKFITQKDGGWTLGDRYNVFPVDGPADWTVLMNYWKDKYDKA